MSSVEERLQRLEDREAIRELKIAYAKACDAQDLNWVVSLFTETAIWDGGPRFGHHEGHEALKSLFSNAWKDLTWTLHYMTGEAIQVDPASNEATGTWYIIEPCVMSGGAVWMLGRYQGRYRNIDGRWLFSEVYLNWDTITQYESGWVKQRFME
jgi:ketosteroid isomerase-like protein